MFNFNTDNNQTTPPPAARASASEVAQISGNMTHVFVPTDTGESLAVFHNGTALPVGSLESLSVNITAPSDTDSGTLTGVLVHYETGADGTRKTASLPLFPGTVEVIAHGRRVAVTCLEAGSFDGLFVRLGTDDNGIGLQVDGASALRLTVSPLLTDARLIWAEDGREDILFEGK